MISKTVLALTIIGTVVAQHAFLPVIPPWISADKHGNGYYISSYWNGTVNYEGETSFSWDFDYNCIRLYFEQYSDKSWGEFSYCDNVVNAYHSQQGCHTEDIGYASLEEGAKEWAKDFTIDWGSGHPDPVWG